MKRTSLSLDDDTALALEREARRRGTSVSQVARDALAEQFGLTGGGPRKLPLAALGRSGRRHTARDLEDELAAEWDRAGGR
ncbi:MAG TPA: CopG family transcriptional regulator [Thermoleophilaceae bacterium]|nr:CopG family transcriptional regulator [Thermoleophilaceae bacterium]